MAGYAVLLGVNRFILPVT